MSLSNLLGKLVGLFTGTLGVPLTLALAAGAVAVVAAWRDF